MSAFTTPADSAHATLGDNTDPSHLTLQALDGKELCDVVAQPMAEPLSPIEIDASRTPTCICHNGIDMDTNNG